MILIELRLLICGNSSGVEHNLAKVGVASSNLVSRSIFFLIFFSVFLSANSIALNPMYCINSDSITLKTLGYDGKDEEILNLNGNKAAKISSNRIASIAKSHLINFEDKSGGEMIFVKDCSEIEKLQKEFLIAVIKEYPDIKFIKFPEISAQNEFPKDFSSYNLDQIYINSLNNSKGTFRAIFNANGIQKTFFFRYEFKALMPVLKAVKNISMRHILGIADYKMDMVNFDNFLKDSFTKIPSSRLISKQNIKNGEILLKRQFEFLTLVKRNDNIQAVLNDGSLSVVIEVKALEHGNLGDIIKVRSKDNKTFYATIVSKKQAIIR